MVGVEVYGAAVDARFDAVLGARDDGGLVGDGLGPTRAHPDPTFLSCKAQVAGRDPVT